MSVLKTPVSRYISFVCKLLASEDVLNSKMDQNLKMKMAVAKNCIESGKRIAFVEEMHSKFRNCLLEASFLDSNRPVVLPSCSLFWAKYWHFENEAAKPNVNWPKLENEFADILSFLLSDSLSELEDLILRLDRD